MEKSTDKVFIKNLRVKAVVGVFEWERCIEQILQLDLEMTVDIAKAAQSDDLKDTIDYKAVAKRAKNFIEESRYQLVETIADRLANILLQEFSISYIRMTMSKPKAVRDSEAVGIIIERTRA